MSLQRPTEDADDPRDVRAIYDAKNNLGDYKIKSTKDFIPSKEDVSLNAKQNEVRNIEESLHALKCDFNQRLKQLRDDKHQIINDITAACRRVSFIDSKLRRAGEPQPWKSSPCPQEFPECRGNVTEQDKDYYIKAIEKCEGNPIQEVNVPPHGIITTPNYNTGIEYSKLPLLQNGEQKINHNETLSALEINKQKTEEVVLMHERSQLCVQIDSKVDSIDRRLAKLRSERIKIQVTVSSGELKESIIAREIKLLTQVESKSNELEGLFNERKHERNKVSVIIILVPNRSMLSSRDITILIYKHFVQTQHR